MNPKERYALYISIVTRAERMNIAIGSRITQLMDIENADKQFQLRLKDFLAADDFNFAHDFCGIQHSMNRVSCRIENFFVPRFAAVQ